MTVRMTSVQQPLNENFRSQKIVIQLMLYENRWATCSREAPSVAPYIMIIIIIINARLYNISKMRAFPESSNMKPFG